MYDLKPPTTAKAWTSAACAAPNCNRQCRTWSRYCTMHARRIHKTRDPNGRVFSRQELHPFQEMASEHLRRKHDHPAILAAIRYLESCLTSPSLPPAVQTEMRRLHAEGAAPLDMLVRALAVFGLMHFNAHSVGRDVVATVNLGRAVFLTVPMGKRISKSGREYSSGINARVCQSFGQTLRDNLGRFSAQFWADVENTIHGPARASEAIRRALKEAPLASEVAP